MDTTADQRTHEIRRYCPMCDKWVPASERECKACGADTMKAAK